MYVPMEQTAGVALKVCLVEHHEKIVTGPVNVIQTKVEEHISVLTVPDEHAACEPFLVQGIVDLRVQFPRNKSETLAHNPVPYKTGCERDSCAGSSIRCCTKAGEGTVVNAAPFKLQIAGDRAP